MNYFCESPSNWLFSAPSDECTINEVREEGNDEHSTFGALEHNHQHQPRRIVNPMVDVSLENDGESEGEGESESNASSIFRQKWNNGKIL